MRPRGPPATPALLKTRAAPRGRAALGPRRPRPGRAPSARARQQRTRGKSAPKPTCSPATTGHRTRAPLGSACARATGANERARLGGRRGLSARARAGAGPRAAGTLRRAAAARASPAAPPKRSHWCRPGGSTPPPCPCTGTASSCLCPARGSPARAHTQLGAPSTAAFLFAYRAARAPLRLSSAPVCTHWTRLTTGRARACARQASSLALMPPPPPSMGPPRPRPPP